MRVYLRKLISNIVNESQKKKIKKFEFNTKKKIINKLPSIDQEKMIDILVNKLGLKKGDDIFIHASMNQLNTNLTASDLYNIIYKIIGPEGSVTVPCYPPMSSLKFMQSNRDFNVKSTRSGMGDFSEFIRKHPNSIRSVHPTKSIASIGVESHLLQYKGQTLYPFGEGSPYDNLSKHKPLKIIGIGVPMSYLSFVHYAEDLLEKKYPRKVYLNEIFKKNSIYNNGEQCLLSSYVHDLSFVTKANPGKFVKKYVNHHKEYMYFLSPFFVVDEKVLTLQLLEKAKSDITIYD